MSVGLWHIISCLKYCFVFLHVMWIWSDVMFSFAAPPLYTTPDYGENVTSTGLRCLSQSTLNVKKTSIGAAGTPTAHLSATKFWCPSAADFSILHTTTSCALRPLTSGSLLISRPNLWSWFLVMLGRRRPMRSWFPIHPNHWLTVPHWLSMLSRLLEIQGHRLLVPCRCLIHAWLSMTPDVNVRFLSWYLPVWLLPCSSPLPSLPLGTLSFNKASRCGKCTQLIINATGCLRRKAYKGFLEVLWRYYAAVIVDKLLFHILYFTHPALTPSLPGPFISSRWLGTIVPNRLFLHEVREQVTVTQRAKNKG